MTSFDAVQVLGTSRLFYNFPHHITVFNLFR